MRKLRKAQHHRRTRLERALAKMRNPLVGMTTGGQAVYQAAPGSYVVCAVCRNRVSWPEAFTRGAPGNSMVVHCHRCRPIAWHEEPTRRLIANAIGRVSPNPNGVEAKDV